MLTADLVLARRRGNELTVQKLDARMRELAQDMAARALAIFEDHEGQTREALDAALLDIDAMGRDKMRAGLIKIIEDRATFDATKSDLPAKLRFEVFSRASAQRREHGTIHREQVFAEAARALGIGEEDIEQKLYGDLRAEERLLQAPSLSPATVLSLYEQEQAQAVLLRAVGVRVHLRKSNAGGLRLLFRKLKFLRLLHVITPSDDGITITIDGPFSLFESVTKYGLALALLVPALEGSGEWELEAQVRWGKERLPLTYRLHGQGGSGGAAAPLSDDVQRLLEACKKLEAGWDIRANDEILELSGVGLLIPDLVFRRGEATVYVEVLGFWSRQAVWRRVELVEAGLKKPILFAVGEKLRVSEEALDEASPSALYVYKGTMRARAVLEKVEALAARIERR